MSSRLLFVLALAARAFAQQTTATMLGTVSDPSGAAVPDVKIQASNMATKVNRETVSDSTGAYSLPNLPPGAYRITASKTGFQSSRVENVTLQVEQVARVDIRLQVGNVTETVDVSASAALLQTATSSVGTVIAAGKIADLPLNGRNFIQLAQL